ncbi:unnamed protein product [Ixodes persulcatus]
MNAKVVIIFLALLSVALLVDAQHGRFPGGGGGRRCGRFRMLCAHRDNVVS